jgi:hypothetical protein
MKSRVELSCCEKTDFVNARVNLYYKDRKLPL